GGRWGGGLGGGGGVAAAPAHGAGGSGRPRLGDGGRSTLSSGGLSAHLAEGGQHLVVDLAVGGDHGGPAQVHGAARGSGDAASRLFRHEASRRPVPPTQAEFPETG